jgi:hypothetical protein
VPLTLRLALIKYGLCYGKLSASIASKWMNSYDKLYLLRIGAKAGKTKGDSEPGQPNRFAIGRIRDAPE